MSRLSAALERAQTGVVARRDERPLAELIVEQPGAAGTVVLTDESSQMLPQEAPTDRPAERHARFRAFSREYAEKLVVSKAMPQQLREQYRRLGATLHHAQLETQVKTLMITSAVPDEGKTLTATNIALTLSESYQRRVLLIDADLRRPSLGEVFQIPKVLGLNEALTGSPDRRVPLIRVSEHLSLLSAGAPDPDPVSILTSDRMRRLLDEAAQVFDWVLIDTPPIGILTDAKLLGTMVDAALLVIRANKTPAALVQRSVDAIGRNRIMGVVLNRAEQRNVVGGDAYYNSYYYTADRGGKGR